MVSEINSTIEDRVTSREISVLNIQGPAALTGELAVRGAKNAILPILVAAASGVESVTLTNVPTSLRDFWAQVRVLRHIGCECSITEGEILVEPPADMETEIPFSLAGTFRYSLLYLGLLAGKCGFARVGVPGGCSLGERKYDLHLDGLRQLGAEVIETEGVIEVKAEKLVGADINLYTPTTTGTETIMLAALFASGTTRIFNAHTRPEIVDMAACLNKMGAAIRVRNRVVEIEGEKPLSGCIHHVLPGWDEALTYITGAGVTGGEVCIRDFSLEHIRADVAYLREAGVDVFEWGGNVYASGRNKKLKTFDLFTGPYPGVNSDMQPIFAVLASQCHGESSITDQRFTDRLQYVSELKKMGMQIEAYGNSALVNGPSRMTGADVIALDLRCGAALLLSSCAAEGITNISNAQQIERGYESVCEKFQGLGVKIKTSQKE